MPAPWLTQVLARICVGPTVVVAVAVTAPLKRRRR